MRKETAAKLTMVLGIIAAFLAFGAALMTFVKDGQIKLSLIAAGLFYWPLLLEQKIGGGKINDLGLECSNNV